MAGVGTEIVFKFRAIPHLPMHERWTALITEFSLNEHFSDTQKQGPFRRWQHTHFFEAKTVDGRDGTLVRDVVEYEVGSAWSEQCWKSCCFSACCAPRSNTASRHWSGS